MRNLSRGCMPCDVTAQIFRVRHQASRFSRQCIAIAMLFSITELIYLQAKGDLHLGCRKNHTSETRPSSRFILRVQLGRLKMYWLDALCKHASTMCQIQETDRIVLVFSHRCIKFSKDGVASLSQSLMRKQANAVTAQIVHVSLQDGLTGHAHSPMRMHACNERLATWLSSAVLHAI